MDPLVGVVGRDWGSEAGWGLLKLSKGGMMRDWGRSQERLIWLHST